jgi:acetyl esterase
MFQLLKVWFLRWIYRLGSRFVWRKQEAVPEANDLHLASSGTGLALRLFANVEAARKPLIVYFHGGGWVIGDLDTHTPLCRELSCRSGCSVVSVDYRLAPEHPFPAAQDDALSALAWIAAHSTKLGPNNGNIIVAGDSAGGNLAAAACLELAEPIRQRVQGAVLLYPVVDHYSAGFASYEEMATGHPLTRKLMHWFWDTYLGEFSPDDPMVQRSMPLRAVDVSAMPETFLLTVGKDPLCDEGLAFAEKLAAAGVAVEKHHFADTAHGFASSEGQTPVFTDLMERLCQWLQRYG